MRDEKFNSEINLSRMVWFKSLPVEAETNKLT